MESLSDTTWDVLIAGTGLPQALLALSLSRSDKKLLHVDKNNYYGGFDAAFSLREAEEWAKKVNDSDTSAEFQNAQIHHPTDGPNGAPSKILEQSRKYTLSLSPQLIYAQSKLLTALVSSRVHTQLEFQAVGSWWVHKDKKLHRIPSGREDVFADDTLSRRDKIALMKFLRTVVNEEETKEPEETAEVPQKEANRPLASLMDEYKISESLNQALLALSLSPFSSQSTRSSYALPRIKRHMTSIGAFGPGFGAVLPKYGGNAEIAQVGCRAGAVGGGVYVLGAGIVGQEPADNPDHVRISLSNDEKVTTSYVVGSMSDLSNIDWTEGDDVKPNQKLARSMHHISIISSPLKQLLPQTSENGPVPAGAIVLVDDKDHPSTSPVYLQVHSEDMGECPSGQCVIYGSTLLTESNSEPSTRERLRQAAEQVVGACDDTAKILWEMSYTSQSLSIDNPPVPTSFTSDPSGRILAFPPQPHDIAFDDSILDTVKAAWEKIMGPAAEGVEFMRFEPKSEDLDEE